MSDFTITLMETAVYPFTRSPLHPFKDGNGRSLAHPCTRSWEGNGRFHAILQVK
ncbi:MAG: hypothetical protein GY943_04250 [Chloroflexi bacterium]|nr:hypothetical protein [Chloroflexota bacterium]